MPVPSLAEVLRQSGWSQEQIDALDAKAVTGFNTVLTTASQAETTAAETLAKAQADKAAAEKAVADAQAAKEAAELKDRSVQEFWNNTYNPGIAAWEKERQELAKAAADATAEAAYYKAQRETYLGKLGIKPEDAPVFTPVVVDPKAANPNGNGTRDAQGRFVPGPTGSPVFDPNVVISRVGDGMNKIQTIMWKYQTLYDGQPLPMSPSELIQKADQLKLDPMEYASRTFRFAEKEEEQRQAAAKVHDDQVASTAAAAKEAEWKAKLDEREKEFAAKEKLHAERNANNPDQRVVVSSKIPELQRKVETKELPDPLLMNENQRRANTAKMIRDTIAANKEAAA
jgi:predicted metal-binding transcription factor (methanogenesis marker protein 9)